MKALTEATITQLREKHGLTRLQLTVKADVSPSTLRKIEQGQIVARKSLEAVCKALNVTPDQVQGVQVRSDYRPYRHEALED